MEQPAGEYATMVEFCRLCGKDMPVVTEGTVWNEYRCSCGHGKIVYHKIEVLGVRGVDNGK